MHFPHHILGRRYFLQLSATGAASLLVAPSAWLWRSPPARAAIATSSPLAPDTALAQLMAGNQRFVAHRPLHPHQSRIRLQETAQAQHPFATVLSCADSRVPVEILFDRGIGDIFDVRIAGNIATPEVIGSIEYAVAWLGTPLLVVLGHERCGAVTAAVQQETLPGAMGSFVAAILPAVEQAKTLPGDAIDNAVLANVRYQVECLQASPLLAERLQAGTLSIVGARYDLDTGKVAIVT